MSGNAPSGSPDIVASKVIETPSSSAASQAAVAVFALSAAVFTGHEAHAADIGVNMTEAKNVCMAESKTNWANLLTLVEKKKKAGEADKAAVLQAKYDKEMAEADKTCDTLITAQANSARSKANIAKSEANIAKNTIEIGRIAEVEKAGRVLDQEISARLLLVDRFSEDRIPEANADIALLNRANDYLRMARAVFTDTESVAKLQRFESNVKLLISSMEAGSRKKVVALNNKL